MKDLGLTREDFAKEFLKFTELNPPLNFNVVFIYIYIFSFKTTLTHFSQLIFHLFVSTPY